MRVTYAAGYGHNGSAQTHTVDVTHELADLPADASRERVLDVIHDAVVTDIGRNASPADLIDGLDGVLDAVMDQLAARARAESRTRAAESRATVDRRRARRR